VSRDRQSLLLYERYRVERQLDYYEDRVHVLRAARGQVVTLTGVLIVLSTTAAALAAADAAGARAVWAVLATAFPALATALGAYASLYGFEPASKIYGDAVAALRRARLEAPAEVTGEGDVAAYVGRVEGIFRREVSQWGQLAKEMGDPGGPSGGAGETEPARPAGGG
jgi:hypothetical protein